MQETWVSSLGWEDPLKKGMATHSSIPAWRVSCTEEPGGLQSMGSQTIERLTLSLSRLWSPIVWPNTSLDCISLSLFVLNNAFFLSFFKAALCGMWDLSSPTGDRTCSSLQWECRVLTTGPPGKSLFLCLPLFPSSLPLRLSLSPSRSSFLLR